MELNKRQKYIKEKYFEVTNRNPLHYSPILNKKLKLSPPSLIKILDLIIKILEEEYDGTYIWKAV